MSEIRWRKSVVVGLIITCMSIPAAAGALPRLALRRVPPPARAVIRADRLRLFKTRLTLALQRRKLVFDRISARLAARIDRLEGIADRVKAAGTAKGLLGKAQSALDDAKATEAQAVSAFGAVPGASDKWAAFVSARQIARQAVTELKQSRSYTRQAIHELRTVVAGLISNSGGSAQ